MRYFRYFKSYALFLSESWKHLEHKMSHLNPPGQNNSFCMPMFIFLVSRASIKFQLSIDYFLNKKCIYAFWWLSD